jgi:hypothetical protein
MIMEIRDPENAEVADYISGICKTITRTYIEKNNVSTICENTD